MAELKEMGIEERFLYELIDLRKRLDLLIRDFQASITVDEKRKPMTKELINPLTGKPF